MKLSYLLWLGKYCGIDLYILRFIPNIVTDFVII